MSKIPVFIFRIGTSVGQIGDGGSGYKACFVKKGVHVPFSIYCHSKNVYLETVGNAKACDCSCEDYPGHMEDWAKRRSNSDYSVGLLIEEASKFKAKKKRGLLL